MGESGSQARKRGKMELFSLIELMPNSDMKRVAGTYSLRTGLKTNTINDMIFELRDAGLIEIKDGLVRPVGFPPKVGEPVTDQGVEEHGDKV